jgi:hypothetical protein
MCLQVPLEELDLRRLREAAEEMREQLSLTSKAVSSSRGRAAQQLSALLVTVECVPADTYAVCMHIGCAWYAPAFSVRLFCAAASVQLKRCVWSEP